MIAIIPARSGSKRIKNKNIKLFKGKPIIYWVINELKKNKKIKKIVVSSDSKKILNIAKKFGADTLLKRSKKLSDDKTPFQNVVVDVIKKINIENMKDLILVVFPCSIFFRNFYLNKAISLLKKNPKYFAMGISKYSHPIQRAYQMKGNKLNYINKKFELTRTQDLKPTFFDVGNFYLGSVKNWKTKLIHSNSVGVLISKTKVIDIDNLEDWNLANKISDIL